MRRAARESRYEGRLLIEEFKREMNGTIRKKLIEVECLPRNIKQWYERVVNLNKHKRENRQEEERLRSRREIEPSALRQNTAANITETQRQQLY